MSKERQGMTRKQTKESNLDLSQAQIELEVKVELDNKNI